MNYLKKLGRAFTYTLITLFISILILTLLNYLNIISTKTVNIFKLFSIIISVFTGSYILGKQSIKKGYLEGIKYGIIISFILFLLNIFFYSINFRKAILFIIIIISTTLGSMIGILRKKKL